MAERGKKNERRPRRVLWSLVLLLAVLLAVLAAAYRDGTGFDALRRYVSYGRAESGAVRYEYDASPSNRYAAAGDALVVLSDTALRVLDREGAEVWSTQVRMGSPALAQGGGRAVAYDVGGTELYVVDGGGELLHLTAAEEEPFVSATLNSRGMLAVTSQRRGYKGRIAVYSKAMKEIYTFDSAQRFLTGGCVTGDGGFLAAVALGQSGGAFASSLVFYDLTEEQSATVCSVEDGLVLAVGGQGEHVAAVADTCLTWTSSTGRPESTYSYGGDYLRGYDLGGDGFVTLLLDRRRSGAAGRLVTVGPDGQETGSLEVDAEVKDLSAAGRYLAVLYSGSLVVYDQELHVYASLRGTGGASSVLMRPDGSALLLSVRSGDLFLP